MKRVLLSFAVLILSVNTNLYGQGSTPGPGTSLISVPFDDGAIGTVGSNTQKNDNINSFTSLQISRAFFQQWTTDGTFQVQGNDVNGILWIAFDNGQTMDIPGAVVWRITTGTKKTWP